MDWGALLGQAARTDNVELALQCFAHVDPHSIAAAEAVLAAAKHGRLGVLRLCLLEGANPRGYDYEGCSDHSGFRGSTPPALCSVPDPTVPLFVATREARRVLLAAGAQSVYAKTWDLHDLFIARRHGAASLAAYWDEPRFLLRYLRAGSVAGTALTLPVRGEQTRRIVDDRMAPWCPAVHYTRPAAFRRAVLLTAWCLRLEQCPRVAVFEVLSALDALWRN